MTALGGRRQTVQVTLLLLCLLTCCYGLTAVRLVDGQYTGLVVAIAEDVAETSRDAIIDGVKRMLSSANDQLYVASRKSLVFSDVTILQPSTWTSGSAAAAAHHTWSDADVRIGGANPQYGAQPYTLQPGVCGEQGAYIHFTPQFFTHSTAKYGEHGRVFVHEWAHYRWGVFDEYGFPGDPRYPATYSYGGQLRVSACSDTPLAGHFSHECSSESPDSGQCRFRADPHQRGVNSSIMSYHFLPNVSQFCDSVTHNPLAPTKQNALCRRRSVWEVMRTHADFSHSGGSGPVPFRPPTFQVVRHAEGRYVLLLDCSSGMNDFQRIGFVRSAAVKFIEDVLPDGTWLSLISFGAEPEVLKPLTRLSSATRKGFTNAVPRVTCDSVERNVVAAIRQALRELELRGSEEGRTDGTVVTVTNGITDDAAAYPRLRAELQRRNVRAVNVIYPPMPEVTALPSLADATAGRNYIVSEVAAGQRGNSSTLAQLSAALEDAVVSQSGNPFRDRVVIYERVHSANADVSGRFVLDTSVGRRLRVTVSYYNRENIFGVTLTGPTKTFGRDDYDDDDAKQTIVFAIGDDDAQSGVWTYNVRSQKDFQPITVTATSLPRNGTPILLHCWTNVGNRGINASQTPLVLHAALFRDGRPIVDARVRAVVERPKVNGSHSSVEVELLDNGSGVPDATRNDGVYSRYFTQYVDPVGMFGFYSIGVWADDNGGAARLVGASTTAASSGVMPTDPEEPRCCGNGAPTLVSESSGPFQRFATAPSVFVVASPPSGVDVFPPGTVTDLKVKDVDPITGYVTLTWTAPGDDYDSGTVSGYEMRYLHEYEALLRNLAWAPLVPDYVAPAPPGTLQEFRFAAPDGRDRHYFFVLVAIDRTGQKSDVSNVVWTFVPPEPTTAAPPPPEETTATDAPGRPTGPSTVARPLLTAELVGIIVGCTLAFLLVVAIIVVLLCARRRRQKFKDTKMTHHTVTPVHGPDLVRPPVASSNGKGEESLYGSTKGVYFTPASSLSPRQFIPASELLQHHEKHREGLPYSYTGHHHPRYYETEEDVHSVTKASYVQYAPMEVVVDRTSITSSKPSSYESQQTAEVTSSTGYETHPRQLDHAGYINSSYEDGSENSAETARLRPGSALHVPLVNVAAPRRVLSESQV